MPLTKERQVGRLACTKDYVHEAPIRACTETSLLYDEAGLKHKTKASCKAGMPASCQRRRECDRCSDSVLAAIVCTRRTVPHDVPKDYTLKQLIH